MTEVARSGSGAGWTRRGVLFHARLPLLRRAEISAHKVALSGYSRCDNPCVQAPAGHAPALASGVESEQAATQFTRQDRDPEAAMMMSFICASTSKIRWWGRPFTDDVQHQVNKRGQKELSWYHKGHDISIITRAFFNIQQEVPSGYIAGG